MYVAGTQDGGGWLFGVVFQVGGLIWNVAMRSNRGKLALVDTLAPLIRLLFFLPPLSLQHFLRSYVCADCTQLSHACARVQEARAVVLDHRSLLHPQIRVRLALAPRGLDEDVRGAVRKIISTLRSGEEGHTTQDEEWRKTERGRGTGSGSRTTVVDCCVR